MNATAVDSIIAQASRLICPSAHGLASTAAVLAAVRKAQCPSCANAACKPARPPTRWSLMKI